MIDCFTGQLRSGSKSRRGINLDMASEGISN